MHWFQDQKSELIFLDLLFFPLIMTNRPVISPRTIAIIAINTLYVLLLVAVNGVCYHIFYI